MRGKVKVKICGLTSLDDARMAWDAGADYLGFILYEKSPRAVSVDTLANIVTALGNGVRTVGVFVNASAETVAQTASACGLFAVQLHGDERPEVFTHMPVPVWRSLSVNHAGPTPEPVDWPADRYLVDAAVPGAYGGTGALADWQQAATLAKHYPLMLAGGLTPANVVAAIEQVQPFGVDVSSGVETAPGRKSASAVRAFIAAAKSAMQNDR